MENDLPIKEYHYPPELTVKNREKLEFYFEQILTEEKSMEELIERAKKAEEDNDNLYIFRINKMTQITNDLTDIFGRRSNIVEYVRRYNIEKPFSMQKLLLKFGANFENYKYVKNKRQKEKAKAKERQDRNKQASILLKKIGYEEYIHYNPTSANRYLTSLQQDMKTVLDFNNLEYTQETLSFVFAQNFKLDQYGNYIKVENG